jgi:hypothetical protein
MMGRIWSAMQEFRRQLEQYLPKIKRGACVDQVELVSTERGEFKLVARWTDPGGVDAEYVQLFTVKDVLGPDTTRPNARSQLAACKVKDRLVAIILDLRLNHGSGVAHDDSGGG